MYINQRRTQTLCIYAGRILYNSACKHSIFEGYIFNGLNTNKNSVISNIDINLLQEFPLFKNNALTCIMGFANKNAYGLLYLVTSTNVHNLVISEQNFDILILPV